MKVSNYWIIYPKVLTDKQTMNRCFRDFRASRASWPIGNYGQPSLATPSLVTPHQNPLVEEA